MKMLQYLTVSATLGFAMGCGTVEIPPDEVTTGVVTARNHTLDLNHLEDTTHKIFLGGGYAHTSALTDSGQIAEGSMIFGAFEFAATPEFAAGLLPSMGVVHRTLDETTARGIGAYARVKLATTGSLGMYVLPQISFVSNATHDKGTICVGFTCTDSTQESYSKMNALALGTSLLFQWGLGGRQYLGFAPRVHYRFVDINKFHPRLGQQDKRLRAWDMDAQLLYGVAITEDATWLTITAGATRDKGIEQGGKSVWRPLASASITVGLNENSKKD